MEDAVHVDPTKLREFAGAITSASAAYARSMEQLDSELSMLLRSWRDEQGAEFAREVKRTRQMVEEFVRVAHQARDMLLADADAADAYYRVQLGR